MKASEANEIIASYMGTEISTGRRINIEQGIDERFQTGLIISQHQYPPELLYSESLDTLIPVWDKLKKIYTEITIILDQSYSNYVCLDYYVDKHCYNCEANGDTLTEAAAIATAKLIQEATEIKGE